MVAREGPSRSADGLCGLKDAAQTYDTLLRNTAQELVRGQGCWWMDLKGTGWFDVKVDAPADVKVVR